MYPKREIFLKQQRGKINTIAKEVITKALPTYQGSSEIGVGDGEGKVKGDGEGKGEGEICLKASKATDDEGDGEGKGEGEGENEGRLKGEGLGVGDEAAPTRRLKTGTILSPMTTR